MHLADCSVGIIGESAIVGGGIPLATGAGLSALVRGTGVFMSSHYRAAEEVQHYRRECDPVVLYRNSSHERRDV